MNYLSDSEYETYGLEPATPESFVAAASSLINTYCRRPTLAIVQFTERVRVMPGRNNLRLTNLPLAIVPVAVGTAFTGRPPHRSVQACLRTRLLRRMSGVEASLGIGMQDAGRWDPSVEDWRIFRPLLSRGLAAANQNVSP